MTKVRKPILICFIGIDGTGKTTLANELVTRLNQHNIPAKYVWSRFEPQFVKPLILIDKTLFHQDKTTDEGYKRYSSSRRKFLRRPIIRNLYEFILLFDYSAQLFFKVRIPLMNNINIVTDRYFFDTLVDLSVNLAYSNKKLTSVLNFFKRLNPYPDIVFLIDIPEKIAFERKNDIPSIEYLNERRQSYINIGKQYSMILLDGSEQLETLHSIIWQKVQEVL
jgi:dTMP kinase